MYSKATENAIAAMTRLAEVYDEGCTRLSAVQIADSRGLQRPYIAKLLSALAQGGLVTSARGPGGGFALARHPSEITLFDVYRLFERESTSNTCPFGGGVCGAGEPCPMHHRLVRLQEMIAEILNGTTLEEFRHAYQDLGHRPARPTERPTTPRLSYRAPRPGSG